MPLPLPAPRHTLEKSGSSVCVTLPRKKNIFFMIWATLWIFGWGYMVNIIIFLMEVMCHTYEIEKITSPETLSESYWLLGAMLGIIPFLLILLGIGVFGISSTLSHLYGKEIFEADPVILKVTKQVFSWKRTREYAAEEVMDLRVTTKLPWFGFSKGFQKLRGLNGMIAFDYGAKTTRFGLEIDEAEAKQIILTLKEGLDQ